MGSFDRSSYKAATLKTLDQEKEKINQVSYGNNSNYAEYAKVVEGVNEFRVLPTGNPTASPYVAFHSTYLPVEVDKKNDKGEKIGTEIGRRRIFIATTHCPAMGGDPVDLYVNTVYEMAEQRDDKRSFLAPINGFNRPNGDWVPGIRPTVGYVCYVYQEGKIKRLELKRTWFNEIQRISAQMSEDDVLTLDVFSDPDMGYPLLITKAKDESGKVKYVVEAKQLKRGQSWDDFFAVNMVSDEVLENLSKLPSLKKLLFINKAVSFKRIIVKNIIIGLF